MKKSVRTILIVLLALVFVTSASWVTVSLVQGKREAAMYEEVQSTFVQIGAPSPAAQSGPDKEAPTPSEAAHASGEKTDSPAGEAEAAEPVWDPQHPAYALEIAVDFDALRAEAPDAQAWLYIPGTEISFPVVQGEDNLEYERLDYTGKSARSGSIFLDSRNHADFTDRASILYGHNLGTGAMFGPLMDYRDDAFLAGHNLLYVVTPERMLAYEVCMVLITDKEGPPYYIHFFSDADYASYLWDLEEIAVATAGDQPEWEDQLLLLSTCTNRRRVERLVVVGRLLY